MTFLDNLFLKLYKLDLEVREYLPPWAIELIGGLALAIVSGSFWRATAISAGYEALADTNNPSWKAGVLDFAQRQVPIVVWFFVVK
jgi:hypothetical protein